MKNAGPDEVSFLCSTCAAFLFGILYVTIQYGSESFSDSRGMLIVGFFATLICVFSILGVAIGLRAIKREGFSLLRGLSVQQNALSLIVAALVAANFLF